MLAILPKESVIKRKVNSRKAIPPIEFVGMTGIGQLPEPNSRTPGEKNTTVLDVNRLNKLLQHYLQVG